MKILLFPLVLVWKLLALFVNLTGRLLAVTIGLAFIVVGGVLSLTGIGALLGIPLLGFGFLLVIRGLF